MTEPNVLTVAHRLARDVVAEIRKAYPSSDLINVGALPREMADRLGLDDMVRNAIKIVRPSADQDVPDLMTGPYMDVWIDANNMMVIQFSAPSERFAATDAFKIPAIAVEGNTWVH